MKVCMFRCLSITQKKLNGFRTLIPDHVTEVKTIDEVNNGLI